MIRIGTVVTAPRVVVAGGHSSGTSDGPVLVVTGGSQGAGSINAAVSGASAALRAAEVQVLHITGPEHTVEVPYAELAAVGFALAPS